MEYVCSFKYLKELYGVNEIIDACICIDCFERERKREIDKESGILKTL